MHRLQNSNFVLHKNVIQEVCGNRKYKKGDIKIYQKISTFQIIKIQLQGFNNAFMNHRQFRKIQLLSSFREFRKYWQNLWFQR